MNAFTLLCSEIWRETNRQFTVLRLLEYDIALMDPNRDVLYRLPVMPVCAAQKSLKGSRSWTLPARVQKVPSPMPSDPRFITRGLAACYLEIELWNLIEWR